MCGKLICKHIGENIFESQQAIVIYTNVNGNICISLDYAFDHADSQKMWVKDGTICDKDKVCMLLVSNDFLSYTLFLYPWLVYSS